MGLAITASRVHVPCAGATSRMKRQLPQAVAAPAHVFTRPPPPASDGNRAAAGSGFWGGLRRRRGSCTEHSSGATGATRQTRVPRGLARISSGTEGVVLRGDARECLAAVEVRTCRTAFRATGGTGALDSRDISTVASGIAADPRDVPQLRHFFLQLRARHDSLRERRRQAFRSRM